MIGEPSNVSILSLCTLHTPGLPATDTQTHVDKHVDIHIGRDREADSLTDTCRTGKVTGSLLLLLLLVCVS